MTLFSGLSRRRVRKLGCRFVQSLSYANSARRISVNLRMLDEAGSKEDAVMPTKVDISKLRFIGMKISPASLCTWNL